MIRLVATDMDHTLLDDESRLPNDFGAFVKELKEQDIKLVIASGRTLLSIKRKVADYLEDVAIISDNGAIVELNGEVAYVEEIAYDMQVEIMEQSRKCRDTSIIGASIDSAYVELGNPEHAEMLNEYYPVINFVDDITKVDDKIIKITLMSPDNNVENYTTHFEKQFENRMNAVMAGKVWIDVMNKGVDKGKGLRFLLENLNIDSKTAIAFGDYHNDIGMLQAAGRGFAVMNAHDDVKEIADGIVGYNYESPVISKSRELIKEEN